MALRSATGWPRSGLEVSPHALELLLRPFCPVISWRLRRSDTNCPKPKVMDVVGHYPHGRTDGIDPTIHQPGIASRHKALVILIREGINHYDQEAPQDPPWAPRELGLFR